MLCGSCLLDYEADLYRFCSQPFEIQEDDRAFYARMAMELNGHTYEMPAPTVCPQCRFQRRLAHRNERHLYSRTCDLTGKPIITVHHPDKPYAVYDQAAWWGDDWDALEYGRPFDFSRPFFEQFRELQLTVPRMSLIISHSENSEYSPYSMYAKNCYMCTSCIHSEDLAYSHQTNYSRDSVDCAFSRELELCYECVSCIHLYHSAYNQFCQDSSEIYFSQDLKNCQHCIGCKNLINQQYYVYNEPVSKDVFDTMLARIHEPAFKADILEKTKTLFQSLPQRGSYLINCENSSGNHLFNCKNATHAFYSSELEDCAYTYVIPFASKDCQDINNSPGSELTYESTSAANTYRSAFNLHAWENKFTYYADECFYSQHLFGCIGLKRQKFSVLNVQYSETEYLKLVPKIIEHMQKTGEWGQYFPMSLSTFAYNETIAQEHYPVNREGALSQGLTWRDPDQRDYRQQTCDVPNVISDVSDQITLEILACETCTKNYKIIPQELDLYRRMGIPIPSHCHECRHQARMVYRSPYALREVSCAKCGIVTMTTYPEDPLRIVWCETCFIHEYY